MANKTFRANLTVKNAQSGQVEARFATLNVIDHDNDVALPGAFQEGQEVVIEPWNHAYSELPVGKGSIHTVGDDAVLRGSFFLETQAGQEHFDVLKNLPFAEYSYTFNILKSHPGTHQGQAVRFLDKLDVWGVAPVTRGAGIGTQTLMLKNRDSVQSVRAQIAALGTPQNPAQAYNTIADLLGETNPPNLPAATGCGQIEFWRRQLLSEEYSPPYVETVIAIEVEKLAERLMREDPVRFPDSNPAAALAEARRQLQKPVTNDTTLFWFPAVPTP